MQLLGMNLFSKAFFSAFFQRDQEMDGKSKADIINLK